MTQVTLQHQNHAVDFDAAVNLMDDDIREEMHALEWDSEQAFVSAYERRHAQKFHEVFVVA